MTEKDVDEETERDKTRRKQGLESQEKAGTTQKLSWEGTKFLLACLEEPNIRFNM